MTEILAALALLMQMGLCQPAALTNQSNGEQRIMLVCDVIEPRDAPEQPPQQPTPTRPEVRT